MLTPNHTTPPPPDSDITLLESINKAHHTPQMPRSNLPIPYQVGKIVMLLTSIQNNLNDSNHGAGIDSLNSDHPINISHDLPNEVDPCKILNDHINYLNNIFTSSSNVSDLPLSSQNKVLSKHRNKAFLPYDFTLNLSTIGTIIYQIRRHCRELDEIIRLDKINKNSHYSSEKNALLQAIWLTDLLAAALTLEKNNSSQKMDRKNIDFLSTNSMLQHSMEAMLSSGSESDLNNPLKSLLTPSTPKRLSDKQPSCPQGAYSITYQAEKIKKVMNWLIEMLNTQYSALPINSTTKNTLKECAIRLENYQPSSTFYDNPTPNKSLLSLRIKKNTSNKTPTKKHSSHNFTLKHLDVHQDNQTINRAYNHLAIIYSLVNYEEEYPLLRNRVLWLCWQINLFCDKLALLKEKQTANQNNNELNSTTPILEGSHHNLLSNQPMQQKRDEKTRGRCRGKAIFWTLATLFLALAFAALAIYFWPIGVGGAIGWGITKAITTYIVSSAVGATIGAALTGLMAMIYYGIIKKCCGSASRNDERNTNDRLNHSIDDLSTTTKINAHLHGNRIKSDSIDQLDNNTSHKKPRGIDANFISELVSQFSTPTSFETNNTLSNSSSSSNGHTPIPHDISSTNETSIATIVID